MSAGEGGEAADLFEIPDVNRGGELYPHERSLKDYQRGDFAKLDDMLDAASVWNPSQYDLNMLFGVNKVPETVDLSQSEGLEHAIWHLMGGEIGVSGSVVTGWENEKYMNSIGRYSILNESLGALMRHEIESDPEQKSNLMWRFNEGDLKVNELSDDGYVGMSFIEMMQGVNMDLRGEVNADEMQKRFDQLRCVLQLGYGWPVDGESRVIVEKVHGDPQNPRVMILKLIKSEYSRSSGVNFILQARDSKSAIYNHAVNLRKDQWGELVRVRDESREVDEVCVEISNQKKIKEMKVEMLAETGDFKDKPGWWEYLTVRTIRAMVMHGMDVDQLDRDSFMKSKPRKSVFDFLKFGRDKEVDFDFEQVIGITSNLVASFMANPRDTLIYIQDMGLESILPNLNDESLSDMAHELTHIQMRMNRSISEWEKTMTSSHGEDFSILMDVHQKYIYSDAYREFDVDLSIFRSGDKEVVEMFANMQNELFPGEKSEEGFSEVGMDRYLKMEFHSMVDMSGLLHMFMPCSIDELRKMTPKKGERYQHKSHVTGNRGLRPDVESLPRAGETISKTVVENAVDVFGELAEEMRSIGDEKREKIFQEAAKSFENQFYF